MSFTAQKDVEEEEEKEIKKTILIDFSHLKKIFVIFKLVNF